MTLDNMLLFLFSILSLEGTGASESVPIDKYYSTNQIEVVCKPCPVPNSGSVIWLPTSRPPCLHPGQPVIHWPDDPSCPIPGPPDTIRSSQVSLLRDGLLLTKERVCFFDGPVDFHYDYVCGGNLYKSKIRIGHSTASSRTEWRRVKRWARRRNPDSNAVHFQQEK